MKSLASRVRKRNREGVSLIGELNYTVYYNLRWGEMGVAQHPGTFAMPDPWSGNLRKPDIRWWRK